MDPLVEFPYQQREKRHHAWRSTRASFYALPCTAMFSATAVGALTLTASVY